MEKTLEQLQHENGIATREAYKLRNVCKATRKQADVIRWQRAEELRRSTYSVWMAARSR